MADAHVEYLIACAGATVRPECASAMERFLAGQESNDFYFVMSNWLAEDQLRGAALLWVVDYSVSWDIIALALDSQIPLLVPEDNDALKQICISANCGMYYHGATDAQLCLTFLLSNDATRRHLGVNGHAHCHSRRAKAAAR
jgi:hypothetical protein